MNIGLSPKGLLGKAWFSYEVLYLVGLILVVSLWDRPPGENIHEMFGISNLMGIILMMTLVGVIVFFGTPLIEKLLPFGPLFYMVFLP
ncbi:MAG: hypothetical protein CM1200mP1_16490 [Candidatus Neomarinimicrobiota bacterium]|nr:MAG: hypothetical protein CM1200mP1_16490 [Candidatus Neomarinimicrobiota bacterium]